MWAESLKSLLKNTHKSALYEFRKSVSVWRESVWDYLQGGPQAWAQRESCSFWQRWRRSGRAGRAGRDRAPSCQSLKAADVSFPPCSFCVFSPLLQSLLYSVSPELRLSSLWGSLIFKWWWQFKVSTPSWLSSLTFDLTQHFGNTTEIATFLSACCAANLWFSVLFIMSSQQHTDISEKRVMIDSILTLPASIFTPLITQTMILYQLSSV